MRSPIRFLAAVMCVAVAFPAIIAAQPWTEKASVPLAPSNIEVKKGGWLAYAESEALVFAAKGYKTGDFYSYDPGTDAWTELASIPLGNENKPPRRGCKGAWADGALYMCKGNNTLGWWSYDPTGNAWTQETDVPLGTGKKKVKGGTDVVYVPGDSLSPGYVYLLKGYKQEFYRYNVVDGTWETLPEAPAGKQKKWDKGSFLVYDGDGTVYAHKAKHHELWAFDLATLTWAETALPGMPYPSAMTGKDKKKCKDGSAGAWYDGAIYALKGGNTNQFWMYDVATAAWSELDTMPSVGSTGKKKRVKHGGDIVSAGEGTFYALKGRKTLEFWQYDIPATDARHEPEPRGGAMGFTLTPVSAGELLLGSALGGPVALTVYDAGGRAVSRRTVEVGPGSSRVSLDLNAGIYLVQASAGGRTQSAKFVVY